MIKEINIKTPLADSICRSLRIGDRVRLTGEIFTARDAAHRRLFAAATQGDPLPIPMAGGVIFYAAPTPPRPGRVVGSVGPTTSYRMDRYTPKLLEMGLKGTIGKGRRSVEVRQALMHHGAVYFGATGGVAALTARFIRHVEVVAYEDLGPEAIMRMIVEELPIIVLADSKGRDLFEEVQNEKQF